MDRRHFVRELALAALFFSVRGAFAQELVRTAAQGEGPFYPDRLPLDTDNDLLIINDAITPAVGDITWLNGRVLDSRGQPLRNVIVEIWQVDRNGAYLHKNSSNKEKRDANFQGFGRFVTGSSGEYVFRTIKPVPYPGRTPHVHFAVKVRGQDKFTTQLYIEGEPGNLTDSLLNSVRDAKAKASIVKPFVPVPGSRTGELAAHFDIVLGFTPQA
jgi:protocatechuate 3,4-dioxygenase beta subunit